MDRTNRVIKALVLDYVDGTRAAKPVRRLYGWKPISFTALSISSSAFRSGMKTHPARRRAEPNTASEPIQVNAVARRTIGATKGA